MYLEKIANGNVLLKDSNGNIKEHFLPTCRVDLVDDKNFLITQNNKNQYKLEWKLLKQLVTAAGSTPITPATTQQSVFLALVTDFFFLDSTYNEYIEDDTVFSIVPFSTWTTVNTGIPNALLDIVVFKSANGENTVSVRKMGSSIDRKFLIRSVIGPGGSVTNTPFRVETDENGEIEAYQTFGAAEFTIIGYWK